MAGGHTDRWTENSTHSSIGISEMMYFSISPMVPRSMGNLEITLAMSSGLTASRDWLESMAEAKSAKLTPETICKHHYVV